MKNMEEFLKQHFNEIKTAIYLVFVSLNIDTDIVKVLMYLMALDTASGIAKAIVLKKEIDFKILFFGLCSKLLILLIPMVLALVGKGIAKTYDFTPLLDSVLKVLVVAEGLSIITNIYSVKIKEDVKNIDIVSMLLSAIRKGMLSLINAALDKIKNPQNINNDEL